MGYQDTYFLNSADALKVALENNKILAPNGQVEAPQICYYDGVKLANAPINCINVPFENIIKYFTITKNRIANEFYNKKILFKKSFFILR